MTRINCIPVTELLDQHLMAEYREITRVSKLARPLNEYGDYKLGKGHVLFFYNKGKYLAKRCEDLYQELLKRNYNVQYKVYIPHQNGLNLDWTPNIEDQLINKDRIKTRYDVNPDKYTYYRKRLNKNKEVCAYDKEDN